MKQILKQIEQNKKALFNNPFCLFLKHDYIESNQKIVFIPRIFDIVIGFRNFLELIAIENPQTELEKLLDTHCKEDNGHWKWYLSDLEQLEFNSKFTLSEYGEIMSSPNSNQIRHLFNVATRYCLSSPDPLKTFAVLEVLEAGFVTFITHMLIPIRDLNLFDTLDYFGRTHYEAEASHQSGNWVDNSVHTTLNSFKFSVADRASAVKIVDEMFQIMEKMFLSWRLEIHKSTKLNFYKKQIPDRRLIFGGDRRQSPRKPASAHSVDNIDRRLQDPSSLLN